VTTSKANLPASVHARLLNRAHETGDDYQTLLTNFCFERFLYRLSRSSVRNRFVLKGAMLLRTWSDQPYRTTRDLDFLRLGDSSFEAVRSDIQTICSSDVEADAIVFEPASIRVDAIRAEDEYAGTRVLLQARCGRARVTLQIDLGFGDAVWPPPRACTYPVLLDFPAPEILAYPPEAVIAEKLEAVVVFGDRNSRIKDHFDLHYLAGHFEFDRATLVQAVGNTFARRRTPAPQESPIGLTLAYWQNPSREPQIRAFAKRARLTVAAQPGPEIANTVGRFLLPVLEDLRLGIQGEGTWPPGGPWQPRPNPEA